MFGAGALAFATRVSNTKRHNRGMERRWDFLASEPAGDELTWLLERLFVRSHARLS